jgi:GDPmannose 4,6-dehydratase
MQQNRPSPDGRRTALIFGIGGQDGAYLARQLLDKGYRVHGTSRDREVGGFAALEALGIRRQVELHSASLVDFRSVAQVLKSTIPDEIYNLAGQSSVGLSFSQPVETLDSIVIGTMNILEAIRFLDRPIRFYNAASGEAFGNTPANGADENSQFHPRSPYGVAKASAFWAVANYREAYGLFSCSGLLFNHESPLRPSRFVTQKVVRGAIEIAAGRASRLSLGRLDIKRDWGWAPEYVDAMWRILQRDAADDFVIATGTSSTLEDFVRQVFECVDLDWREHVDHDPSLVRPADIETSVGNPDKARRLLGWQAHTKLPEIVRNLVAAARNNA